MSTSQAGVQRGRWGELLLGGTAAGVGAPLLLGGLRRVLRLKPGSSATSVGWAAGVLGALVAGGLARRRLQAGRDEARAREEDATSPPPASHEPAPLAEEEAEALDWRRQARRRRLAALESRAATSSEKPGREAGRAVERGPRRGPSGREQPWHEALASTSG